MALMFSIKSFVSPKDYSRNYRNNPEVNKFEEADASVQFFGYPDSTRLGLFIMGKKKNVDNVVDVEDLRRYKDYNRNQKDVFVSMNGLSFVDGKIARDQEHVSYLNRLWADIDCNSPEEASEILYELQEDVFNRSIPEPTYCMFSGTGLWLFWAISAPIKAISKWHKCQQHIYEVLKGYGSDGSVTHVCCMWVS